MDNKKLLDIVQNIGGMVVCLTFGTVLFTIWATRELFYTGLKITATEVAIIFALKCADYIIQKRIDEIK